MHSMKLWKVRERKKHQMIKKNNIHLHLDIVTIFYEFLNDKLKVEREHNIEYDAVLPTEPYIIPKIHQSMKLQN